MIQQGQVFKLASVARDGGELWAYRYRTGGRDSRRIQRGGFPNEQDARAALERALDKLRRANGSARMLTLGELAERYLDQHEVSPVTLDRIDRACTSNPTVTVVDSAVVGDLRMWLYRAHPGNPRQMRRRRPLSADDRTPPPAGPRLHPV